MLDNNKCSLTPDKFGFYQVGDFKTYSKIEALEVQRRTGKFPQWIFNDSVFSQCNWLAEPEVDLWELYKSRARQIRDSYDYVVLLYSAGSDSQNLISAWIDAGLKIDEIATQWNYAATDKKLGYWNGEITKVALPIVNELKKKNVEFKFRLIDVSENTRDIVDFHGNDYKYYANSGLSPNNHAKNLWRHQEQDYKDLIAQGKKLCFVWGSEKPRLGWDNRLYVEFQDLVDNCVNPYTQMNYSQGWYDELFYWTPDLPAMLIKQAHVIKRFLQTVNDVKYYTTKKTAYGYNKTLNMYLTDEAVKLIIYPYWDPTTYVDGKPGVNIISWRDQWLIHSSLQQGLDFKKMLTHLQQDLDPFWLNNPTDITRGITGCVSPRYYLE